MEKEFKFVGKGLSDKEREKFQINKEEIERESLLPFELESEKDEKIIEIIHFINKCSEEIFIELELKYKPIPMEKIHVFLKEEFEKTFPETDKKVKAFSSPYSQDARIKISENNFTDL